MCASLGGKDVRSAAQGMARRLMCDIVALKYSFTGKRMRNSDKMSFMATKSWKVIVG